MALPAPGAPLGPGEGARLLARHVPELRYDRRERTFATVVEALASRAVLRDGAGRVVERAPAVDRLGVAAQPPAANPRSAPRRDAPSGSLSERRRAAGAAGTGAAARGAALDAPSSGLPERGDVAYGHALRDGAGRVWLQYWLFSTDNLQDRGILRTGRHEGDWELVQLGLDAARRPATLTLAQHSWAEGCASRARRPVVWVAHGSHASYPGGGERGRPWPDPDDEARGDGRRVVPRVVPISDRSPSWVAWPGRWGGSEAAWWNPAENGSPPGPAFQEAGQWRNPAGFHMNARPCGSGAPPRPAALTAGAALVPLLALAVIARRRRRRRRR